MYSLRIKKWNVPHNFIEKFKSCVRICLLALSTKYSRGYCLLVFSFTDFSLGIINRSIAQMYSKYLDDGTL